VERLLGEVRTAWAEMLKQQDGKASTSIRNVA